jgi:iron uptake system EfeUOB component EfeO/EfeM
MLVKAINLAIAFLTLNKGAKANAKAILTESMDIGLAISRIAKNKKVDKKAKDRLAKEVKEFNKAVNKFLDDLVIPE